MIEIKTVQKSIVEYLRIQIATGRLKANQKLNENELAAKLGISRPPIREAFRILESEHLVYSIPRKGTYVADVSIEDLHSLSQARKMVEIFAIDFIEANKIKDLSQLQLALEEASDLALPTNENPEELLHWYNVFFNFHKKLVELVNNSWITDFYKIIASNLTRYRTLYMLVPSSLPHSIRDHREIFNSIKRGDYNKAKSTLLKHLDYVAEIIQKKILERNPFY